MIFADTSFFVAGIDDRDANHLAAMVLRDRVKDPEIVTTNQIRGETWTWLQRKLRHGKAVEFLDSLDAGSGYVAVLRITEQMEREALRWLRRHDEREYSFVDATSFAFMRANRISEALAFDGDFAAAGFVELRPGSAAR